MKMTTSQLAQRLLYAFALFVATFAICASTRAATLYWDQNGTPLGSGGPTPTGTWSTAAADWNTDLSGGSGTIAVWANSTSSIADFSAGADATGSYAVTISGTVQTGGIVFEDGSVAIGGTATPILELNGSGISILASSGTDSISAPITLQAAQTWTNNSASTFTVTGAITNSSNTLTISGAGNTTISGVLGSGASPTGGLTMAGSGTLTLNGAAVNAYTGATTVNGGTLLLDFSNLASGTNLINSSSTLALGGGVFQINAKSSGSTAQTLGNETVNAGGGQILVNPNGGTGTTLTLGTITDTAAGGSLLIGEAASAGTGTLTITTQSPKDATGIYGGRVVFTSDGGTTVDWATTASSSSPYMLSAYSGYTAMAAGAVTDTLNDRLTAGLALSGAQTHNSLKIENPAASQSLALGANNLTLTNGGLLATGTNAFTISNSTGVLTAGNSSGSYDLIVQQYNTGGLTITANIANNGSNATSLTKAGGGSLTLSGATNTYSGGTYVNNGTLAVSLSSAPLGTGTITLAGGRLQLQSGNGSIGINFATGQSGGVHNVTGTAGFVPMGNWNNVTGITGTNLPLVNSTGAGSGATLTFTANSNWSSNINGDYTNQDQQLLNSYLDSNSSASRAQVTVNNVPYSSYTAYLYVNSDTANRGQKANLLGSQTGPTYYYQTVGSGASTYQTTNNTTPSTYPTADYLVYSGLNNSSSVTFQAGYDNNNGGITGLEIVPTTPVAAPVNLANAVAVTTNSTIDVTGFASASLGALSINASKLAITGGSTGAGAAYSLALGATTLTGNATFDVANNGGGTGTLTLGAVTGSGFGFTKQGLGTLALSQAAGTFNGQLNVIAGTLQASNSATAMGTTGLLLNGGSLYLTNPSGTSLSFGNATTISANTQITSDVTVSNTAGDTFTLGAVTIGGPAAPTITIAGGANVNSGTAGVTFGAVTLSSAPTFNITNPTAGGATLLTVGGITNGANTITLTGNGNFAQTGVLGAGAGGFTVGPSFTGTATLNQANTYTGQTTLNSGTLVATGSTGALGTGVSRLALAGGILKLTNASGSSLSFNRNTTVTGNAQITSDVTGANTAGDSFTLSTLSIGGQTLNIVGGTNVNSGTANVTFGNVTLTGSPTFNVTNPTAGGATQLALSAISGTGDNLLVTGNGNVNVGAITTGAGTVTMSGTGTWTMSGANTYTGVTTVNSGTLKSNVATVAGTSGAFGNNSAVVMGASGSTLDISNNSTQIGSLTGGNASVGGGSLGNSTLSVGGDNTSPAAFVGVISGNSSSAVTKIGSGTLTLSGVNSFTGQLTVSTGTLSIPTINNANSSGPLGAANNSVNMAGSGLTATLEYTGSTASSTKSFFTTTSGTSVFQVDNAGQVLTLSGSLGTNGPITINKTGAGTLNLTGPGQFGSGSIINVNAGILQAGVVNGNSAPNTGPLGDVKNGNNFYNINNGGTFQFTVGGTSGNSYATTFGTMDTGVGSGNSSYTWTINAGGMMTSTGGFINMIGGDSLNLNGGTLQTANGADVNNQTYFLQDCRERHGHSRLIDLCRRNDL